MAKGARASKIKANNSKLKSKVFGPIEAARTERLSAKLLELASQPKPTRTGSDNTMDIEGGREQDTINETGKFEREVDDMEVDQTATRSSTKPKASRRGIQKKRSSRSKASIVFPKYKSKAKR